MEGKILIFIGITLILLGIAFSGKLGPIGKLPGDISYSTGNVSFFFPIVSMIIISIVLTIIFNLSR